MVWPSDGGRAGCCQRERRPSLILGECGHIFEACYLVEDDEVILLQSSLCHGAMSDGRALVARAGYGGGKITFTIVMSRLTAASDELILGYGVRITR
ncbi:hypothetical protein ZWY2020_013073 [Hordeum vulgare]|nr:hypothetical protein ZWY2020_013073 [Hordeum vulgare]